MFSGTISCVGHVVALKSSSKTGPIGANLEINVGKANLGVVIGGILNFSGICLRVSAIGKGKLSAYVPEGVLRATTINGWGAGHAVNLETPLRLGDVVGGHLIYGRIDCVGVVIACKKSDNGCTLSIMASDEIFCYIAINGCLAVDGVAVCVAEVSDNTLSFSVDERVLSGTVFAYYVVGSRVNIEVDMAARYLINYIMLK